MTSLLDVARDVLLPPAPAPAAAARPIAGEILTPELEAALKNAALGAGAVSKNSVDITSALPRLVTKHWALVGIYLPLELAGSAFTEGPNAKPTRPKHPVLAHPELEQQARKEKETEAEEIARDNHNLELQKKYEKEVAAANAKYEEELATYEADLGTYEKEYAEWVEEDHAKLQVALAWIVKITRAASAIWQTSGQSTFDRANVRRTQLEGGFEVAVSEDFVNPIDIGPHDQLTLAIQVTATATVTEGKVPIGETRVSGLLKQGAMRYTIPREGR